MPNTPKHTTLRVHEALLRRAKAYAQRNGSTLTAVMEAALSTYLADADRARADTAAVELPAFGRGGVRAGVNLDDTSALLDIMDGVD
jgi:hypothetical protein